MRLRAEVNRGVGRSDPRALRPYSDRIDKESSLHGFYKGDLAAGPDEQIERLAEMKASRDILTHNRGVVNETYAQKSGARARCKVGQRMEIPEPYLRETRLLIGEIVRDMAVATIAKA